MKTAPSPKLPSPAIGSSPSTVRPASRRGGFTLVEALMGTSLMSLCATFAYAAILSSNRSAVTNRLFTLAQELARNQIDRIQCATPYNPQLKPPQVPADLVTGTTLKTLPLYIDPTSNATVVTADITTQITDLLSYNSRSALVTVEYTFRGKKYRVQMNTLRTSDS